MLDPEQRERLRELFDQALDLDPVQWQAFATGCCPDDEELRSELVSLLQAQHEVQDTPSLSWELPDLSGAFDGEVVPALDHYDVEELIGEGGMGQVYRARQTSPLERVVALKQLRAGMDGESFLARFADERQSLARMEHAGIAKIFDAGTDRRGRPYFSMEYVEGLPIHEYCDSRQLGIDARLRLFVRVCEAVQHAHGKGVLHRDLKPSNVLVVEVDGVPGPKVIDFGIAKALEEHEGSQERTTRFGSFVGTPEYMSPEQLSEAGGWLDVRSDVYALGVLLYQVLTGVLPTNARRPSRSAESRPEVAARTPTLPLPSRRVLELGSSTERIVTARATRAGQLASRLRGDLDWIVTKALEWDRRERYASVDALAEDLQQHLRHGLIAAGPKSSWYLLRKFARRHRGTLVASSVLLATLFVSIGLVFAAAAEADRAREREGATRRQEQLTTDPLRAARLIERALAPWPPETSLQANLLWIEDWVTQAGGVLARASASGASRSESFVQALRQLEELRPEVSNRKQILERHWPVWERSRADLSERPSFRGMDLSPLPGLIPIGLDRDHDSELGNQVGDLWLFACGGTGELPRWVDDQGRPARLGEAGRAVIERDTALLLVLVPAGKGYRGSQIEDPEQPNYDPMLRAGNLEENELVRERGVQVIETGPFFLGKCETTQGQFWSYLRATGRPMNEGTPDFGRNLDPGRLLCHIDWREARDFCRWLGGDLPTESQWEYAARAGTTTPYWSGATIEDLSRVGWFRENVERRRDFDVIECPTGRPTPNPWGLYGVHGNALEWCRDRVYSNDSFIAREYSNRRPVRGGDLSMTYTMCRTAYRWTRPAGTIATNFLGVRVFRGLGDAP